MTNQRDPVFVQHKQNKSSSKFFNRLSWNPGGLQFFLRHQIANFRLLSICSLPV
jgi:hypothetical protein